MQYVFPVPASTQFTMLKKLVNNGVGQHCEQCSSISMQQPAQILIRVATTPTRCTHRAIPDVPVVGAAGLVACRCVHGPLIAWLIEVGLIHKDERLDRNQHLHSTRG